jgi:hypothetical protein
MESVDLAQASDQADQDVHFVSEIVILWEEKIFKGFFHRWNCGQVSDNFLSRLYNNILVEVLIFVHVGQKGKETVLIEHFDIIGLVLIKDITQVDFKNAKDHTGVDFINDRGVLIIKK